MRNAIFCFLVFAGCSSEGGADGDADMDVDADVDADTDGDCPDPLVCGPETSLDCHCNTNCVDTLTHPQNCGACFLNCNVDEGESSACVDGVCMCGDSATRCGGDLDDWCCPSAGVAACVSLLLDENNCGECGVVCGAPTSSMCRQGICTCGVPKSPEVEAAPCTEPQVCCGEGPDATCQPAGSC